MCKMKSFSVVLLFAIILTATSCGTRPGKQGSGNQGINIEFVDHSADNKIDVLADGKPFTSYCWFDNVYKPILYPVCTAEGTEITRGFPLNPKPGESTDHRHQVGIWLNYGNVNGLDFWGNGSEGKWGRRSGEVRHLNIENMTGGNGEGILTTNESWRDSVGNELLAEKTVYHFMASGPVRIIDRITTLTATGDTVRFKDTKEGMFGIRVARQLQLSSKDDVVLKESNGGTTTVPAMSNDDINGNYRSSEGIEGDSVWSTRAKWMDLYGTIGSEKISLVVCDHPGNQSYPTYWHARGYGLFSANPLGGYDFTGGKETVNFRIPAGKSATFRYRVIISSGAFLTDNEINDYCRDFSEKYQ
jgi:Family of unknown function (DUF6807)